MVETEGLELVTHHPVFQNRRTRRWLKICRFCGGCRGFDFRRSVSADISSTKERFSVPSLCSRKFRSWRRGLCWGNDRDCLEPAPVARSLFQQCSGYCGFSPSASNNCGTPPDSLVNFWEVGAVIYKGVEYQVVQTANPSGWKWTVYLDAIRTRTGERP
jgi:hypothetical protein